MTAGNSALAVMERDALTHLCASQDEGLARHIARCLFDWGIPWWVAKQHVEKHGRFDHQSLNRFVDDWIAQGHHLAD